MRDRRWRWGRGAAGIGLALGVVCSCSEDAAEAEPPRPNILLISLDTLRADHLGCYGYDPYDQPVSPAIDGLAAEGLRCERLFTPRGQTLPSLATMMSGCYPSIHGIRENGHTYVGSHATLAERLGRVGYRTAAYVAIMPGITPDRISASPARGFEQYASADSEMQGMRGKESLHVDKNDWDRWVTDRGIDYLRAQEGGDEPFFLWLHLYSIHRAYTPPAPYHTMFAGDYDGALRPADDAPLNERRRIDVHVCEQTLSGVPFAPDDQAYVVSQYDGGARYYDDLVGEILQALEASGEADDTLVMLTADHGEELGDHHNYWFHGNSLFDSTLRLPFIARWPGEIPPGVHEGLAQNVDLVPTVLDLLELPADEDVEGQSFGRALRGEARGRDDGREACYFEWQDLIWSVRTDRWKYIENPHQAHPKKAPFTHHPGSTGVPVADQELYDLNEDPAETRNRIDQAELAPMEALRRLMGEFRARPGQVENWNGLEAAEVLEQLERLGYIASIPGRPDVHFRDEDAPPDDPEDGD